MEAARNKPRVFLSYSASDAHFIERLAGDLRPCQIEPWEASLEIRHGQPWLDAIFESGIPTCDSVLVYLTEASIQSPIVKKEIDAGILQKLKDKRIAFLPYVSSAEIRSRLRPDIQALQTPEWNDGNYRALLPRVVAEIWRSYLDRALAWATSQERAKRLEAELQLEQLRGHENGIFARSEQTDFGFIHKTLNRREQVVFEAVTGIGNQKSHVEKTFTFSVHILSLLMALVDQGVARLERREIPWLLQNLLKDSLPDQNAIRRNVSLRCSKHPELAEELLMLGLLERVQATESSFMGPNSPGPRVVYHLVYSDKMNRFRYWLSVNSLMPTAVDVAPS